MATINGVDIGENWRNVADAHGAHVDQFATPGYGYMKQVVITHPSAVGYLKGKVDAATQNDPIDGRINGVDGSNTPHQPGEMILRFVDMTSVDQDGTRSIPLSSQIRADIKTETWREDIGDSSYGAYREHRDLNVRFVRSGWQEVLFVPGRSGDPDMYQQTGRGWNEWEIGNWMFHLK